MVAFLILAVVAFTLSGLVVALAWDDDDYNWQVFNPMTGETVCDGLSESEAARIARESSSYDYAREGEGWTMT